MLSACLQFDAAVDRAGERLGNYAFLKTAEDQGDSDYQRMKGRYQHAATRAAEASSWMRPEILAIPPERMAEFLQARELQGVAAGAGVHARYRRPHTCYTDVPRDESTLRCARSARQMSEASATSRGSCTARQRLAPALEVGDGEERGGELVELGHFTVVLIYPSLKLNLVSGLEVGFGGVWVGAAPYLLFIPDRDGDDRPDGPPQVLLDGWGQQDTHETLNSFNWGPDGWLYGCHGVFTHSRVGKPGTPEAERVPIDAGIWRYHPTTHRFEVFAHGTSNPWGLDFDAHGQAFLTACVIPHLYHVVQGARYERQAGPHFNPYTYDDIKTIADHRPLPGANPHAGNGRSDGRRRRPRPRRAP
jgi:hypothetical protein